MAQLFIMTPTYSQIKKEEELMNYYSFDEEIKDPLATVQRGFGTFKSFYKFSELADYSVVRSIWVDIPDSFDPEPYHPSYTIFVIKKNEDIRYLLFDWNYKFKDCKHTLEEAHELGKSCYLTK
jgi:hypothetical protein